MARYDAEVITEEPHPWGVHRFPVEASSYEAAVGKAAREYKTWFREHKPRKRLRTNMMIVKVRKALEE